MDEMAQAVTDQTFDSVVIASARPVLVDYGAARCVP